MAPNGHVSEIHLDIDMSAINDADVENMMLI